MEAQQVNLESKTIKGMATASQDYEKEMHDKKPEGRRPELEEPVKKEVQKADETKLESSTVRTALGDALETLSNLFTKTGVYQLIILFTLVFMHMTGLGLLEAGAIMLAVGAVCNYFKIGVRTGVWNPLTQGEGRREDASFGSECLVH